MVGKKKQYTALGDYDKNEMIVRSGSIINIKENILITTLLYVIGVLSGFILGIFL